MNWLSAAALARFITWRTRLNRMQFGLGLFSVCFVGALVMQMALFAIASVVGSIEVAFDHTEWVYPPLVLIVTIWCGLLAGRAHDVGWPGWPFVALYMLPMWPWLVMMDAALGIAGGNLRSFADQIPLGVQSALVFVPIGVFWISFIVLATVPGQRRANQYGDAPLPGL